MGKRLVIIGADFSQYGMQGESIIATPVITASGNTITITAAEGSIYYTLNGSDPTINSTLYDGPFTITGVSSATIKAIAAVGEETSNIATYVWTDRVEAPTITASGSTITMTAPAGTIYYTLDGTTPTTASTKYTAPFSMGTTVMATIKAIAVFATFSSDVTTYNYSNVPAGYGVAIIDGTESWNFNNNSEPNQYGYYNCYSLDAPNKFSNVKVGGIENRYFVDATCSVANYDPSTYFNRLADEPRQDTNAPGFNWFNTDPSLYFRFDSSIATTAAGFQTWLRTHPITVIYQKN